MEKANRAGNDVLHIAAKNGYTDIVELILQNGHSVRRQNKEKMNALQLAVKMKKMDCVEKILKISEENSIEMDPILSATDKKENTALRLAIINKDKDMVELLLPYYNKLETSDEKIESLFNFCAQRGTLDIMEMLWSHKQLDSEQCLAILLNNSLDGNIDIAKSFLKKKGMKINREGLLGKAIEKGKVEFVNFMIDTVDIQWKLFDKQQEDNLLHLCIRAGKFEIWKIITNILSGKDKELCANMLKGKEPLLGNSPLHEACKSHFTGDEVHEMISFYKKHEIKLVDLRNSEGLSPLHLASKSGNLEIVKTLYESDKDHFDDKLIDLKDNNGNKAIHFSTQNEQVFDFLLNASGDHKPKNHDGETPLHLIGKYGREECLDILVEHVNGKSTKEINPNKRDGLRGQTPLHIASAEGFDGMVKALLNIGSDVTILDDFGNNALMTAIENKRENVMKAFIESDFWKEALRCAWSKNEKSGLNNMDTPMRQLIKHYPIMAERVLDKCKEVDLAAGEINYNFEFLEDTFLFERTLDGFSHVFTDNKSKKRSPYSVFYKSNHPLMIIRKDMKINS